MKKAMILAAGRGTRLRPFTDTMPKALFPVKGVPLLKIVIDKLIQAGFQDIIINVHHYAEKIEDYLIKNHNFGINICLSHEQTLLETGGGVKKASWFFEKSDYFLVHNVDIISNINLNEFYTTAVKNQCLATLAVSNRNTGRYLLFDNDYLLKGWKNINTQEIIKFSEKELIPRAFSGIQVLSEKIINLFPEQEIFSLTDFYLSICEKYAVKGWQHDPSGWMDVGKSMNNGC